MGSRRAESQENSEEEKAGNKTVIKGPGAVGRLCGQARCSEEW